MDYFESIVKTLLEEEGYWCRQSFKVNVTKEEKRQIGKPSIPRPEIDLIAFKPKENRILAIEVKSYLDSPGVRVNDLEQRYDLPTGGYKLFTCEAYRKIVFNRLQLDLIEMGLIDEPHPIQIGLVAGRVYKKAEAELQALIENNGMFFLGPSSIKARMIKLASKKYENDPVVIAAKLLVRDT